MQYFIRHIKADHFELAKFDPAKNRPLETYRLHLDRKWCDCPSRKQPCKHYHLVKRWLQSTSSVAVEVVGKVVVYDDKTDEFITQDLLDDTDLKKLLNT